MDTLALRFSDNFAPQEVTIQIHKNLISQNGFVWYGKLGAPISAKTASIIMNNEIPKILLIHSGRQNRYWAYVQEIKWDVPETSMFPPYYEEKLESFKTWFKITKIENAGKDVMAKCQVKSSGAMLSEASKKSMSPFFVISYKE